MIVFLFRKIWIYIIILFSQKKFCFYETLNRINFYNFDNEGNNKINLFFEKKKNCFNKIENLLILIWKKFIENKIKFLYNKNKKNLQNILKEIRFSIFKNKSFFFLNQNSNMNFVVQFIIRKLGGICYDGFFDNCIILSEIGIYNDKIRSFKVGKKVYDISYIFDSFFYLEVLVMDDYLIR